MTAQVSALLVDMDGTLIDTAPVVCRVLAETTKTLLGYELPEERARTYIGPPLLDTMRELAGDGGEEGARALIEDYRRRYMLHHLEIEAFEGVEEMLRRVRQAGVTLALATSKPEDRALELLRHLGLERHFEVVCGAPPDDGPGSEKSAVVGRALSELGLKENPERALMIGDRRYDVEGAGAWGVRTILALWARLADPSEQALAWRLAETPAEAADIICKEAR